MSRTLDGTRIVQPATCSEGNTHPSSSEARLLYTVTSPSGSGHWSYDRTSEDRNARQSDAGENMDLNTLLIVVLVVLLLGGGGFYYRRRA